MDVGGVAIASIQALDQRDTELSLKAEQLALANARLPNDVASLKSELADVKALLLQLAP